MFKALSVDATPEATEHWWHQRLTAGANLFLLLWFVVSLALLGSIGFDAKTLTGWASQTTVVILLLLLVGATAYHFRLGLQVAIEDYLAGAKRAAALVVLNFFTFTVAVWAVLSILKLALNAAA